MKKIIFGGASALLAVVGFSSFSATKKFATSYYWFSTAKSPSLTIVSFERFAQTPGLTCNGGPDFCAVAYTFGQVQTDGAGHVTSVKSADLGAYKTVLDQPSN